MMRSKEEAPDIDQDARGSEEGSLWSAEPEETIAEEGRLHKDAPGFQHIPERLIRLRHWVLWRWKAGRNKRGTRTWKKVPYQPNNQRAHTNDPATWCDYSIIVEKFREGGFDGIGFCLLGSGLVAFDIDSCRDPKTGKIHLWALEKVKQANTYAEVTVSGTGVRIIGTGSGPEVHRKLPVADRVFCELYRNTKRYIVMTGHRLEGSPDELANIDAIFDQTLAELDGPKERKSATEATSKSGNVEDLIKNGPGERFDGDRSRAVFYVICELSRRGYGVAKIVQVLTDRTNRISEHIYDNGGETFARDQVEKAREKLTFATKDNSTVVIPNQGNIRIAFIKLGISLKHDQFADQIYIEGLSGFGPVLDDPALYRIWLLIDQEFHFLPSTNLLKVVLEDTGRLNGFHPVKEYLDGLRWDGVLRVDSWLTTYAGAEDSPYTRAVGAIFLTAAVRRVREPGCKFDEMLYFISAQGAEKSESLRALAVRDDWFTDNLPLTANAKKTIEILKGKWIVEAAELNGMRKADAEHLKAFLSRRVDEARLAFGRLTTRLMRQCVIAGTTNLHSVLKDITGNRRFWPITITAFDKAAIVRDRDQLWAEAAAREASGASIRLPKDLWEEAGKVQESHTVEDPWLEKIREALGEQKGKIAASRIWDDILLMPASSLDKTKNQRLSEVMRKLGWRRPNTAGTVKIGDRLVAGYVKGEKPWAVVRPSVLQFRSFD